MKKRSNNKGFTLVELLVAITVLVIVAVPILHSFVTAARVNAKAKLKMEATTVAENVMERIKATDTAALLDTNNANVTYDATTKQYTVNFDGDPVTVNNKTFSANAVFDAGSYADINNEKLSDISKMDVLKDGFYVQSSAQDGTYAENLAELYQTATGNTVAKATVLSGMIRTITIDISSTVSGNESIATVDLTYNYSYGGQNSAFTTRLYDNSNITNGTLDSVYLFYYPLYSSRESVSPKDNIIINNKNEAQANVFLVKQGSSSDTTSANELQYKVGVTVNEAETGSTKDSQWHISGSGFTAATKIRTNINWSVLKNSSGGYDAINTQAQVSYKRTGTTLNGSQALNYLSCLNLQGEKTENRVYKVTVNVYKGTDTEEEKYSSDNFLLSFVGTKEN